MPQRWVSGHCFYQQCSWPIPFPTHSGYPSLPPPLSLHPPCPHIAKCIRVHPLLIPSFISSTCKLIRATGLCARLLQMQRGQEPKVGVVCEGVVQLWVHAWESMSEWGCTELRSWPLSLISCKCVVIHFSNLCPVHILEFWAVSGIFWVFTHLILAWLGLRSPVFTHGQFYVGVSRVTSSQDIKVILDEKRGCYQEHSVWWSVP